MAPISVSAITQRTKLPLAECHDLSRLIGDSCIDAWPHLLVTRSAIDAATTGDEFSLALGALRVLPLGGADVHESLRLPGTALCSLHVSQEWTPALVGPIVVVLLDADLATATHGMARILGGSADAAAVIAVLIEQAQACAASLLLLCSGSLSDGIRTALWEALESGRAAILGDVSVDDIGHVASITGAAAIIITII